MPAVWAISLCRFGPGMRLLRSLGLLPRPEEHNGAPQRFLVSYLTGRLGDIVLMLPMIEALRREHPHARIEVAVQRDALQLLQSVPLIDRVWGFDLPSSTADTKTQAVIRSWQVTRAFMELMSDEPSPAVCISPRWGDDAFRSADLAYLSGARQRIGFDFPMIADRIPFGEVTFTRRVAGGKGMHESVKGVYLLQEARLVPIQDLSTLNRQKMLSLREVAQGIDWRALRQRLELPERFVVIAPGAAKANRRWPVERWARIAEYLLDGGLKVVILSGPSDASVAREVHERTGRKASLAAGVTSLPETVALLVHAALFLGMDSGPGHVAGALGTQSIVLMIAVEGADRDSPHAPERFGPTGPNVTCLCIPNTLAPCKDVCSAEKSHCILTIGVQEVLQVAHTMLGE